MNNDSYRSPKREHVEESEPSVKGLDGEPFNKIYSPSAILFIRIALSVYLLLQSQAIHTYVLFGHFLTALGGSDRNAAHKTLWWVDIVLGMLTIIGIVCIWWIVPPRPLRNLSKYSTEATYYILGIRAIMAICLSLVAALGIFFFGIVGIAVVAFLFVEPTPANGAIVWFALISIPTFVSLVAFILAVVALWPRRAASKPQVDVLRVTDKGFTPGRRKRPRLRKNQCGNPKPDA